MLVHGLLAKDGYRMDWHCLQFLWASRLVAEWHIVIWLAQPIYMLVRSRIKAVSIRLISLRRLRLILFCTRVVIRLVEARYLPSRDVRLSVYVWTWVAFAWDRRLVVVCHFWECFISLNQSLVVKVVNLQVLVSKLEQEQFSLQWGFRFLSFRYSGGRRQTVASWPRG